MLLTRLSTTVKRRDLGEVFLKNVLGKGVSTTKTCGDSGWHRWEAPNQRATIKGRQGPYEAKSTEAEKEELLGEGNLRG